MANQPKYNRILLKLSGEALLPKDSKYGIGLDVAQNIAQEIKSIHALGVQVGIVVGGGNIFRGLGPSQAGMDRSTADNMGMLATVINSLALQDALIKAGVPTRILTSFTMHQIAEPFSQRAAMRYLGDGNAIILAGGTGNPYFTTDTAASLRALEIHADVLCKGTKVDGIYNKDPMKHADSQKFDQLTYLDALKMKLQVMDLTAISMCMDTQLPIVVFDMFKSGNLHRVVQGEKVGTLVIG
ncbi:MAG: UMP kinase [Deltaproteobacteria bacterium]|nr:UMP kinase [Deltaproteobacteria bacterium]